VNKMDEITKTGTFPINENKPVYVKVCSTCKEAFRTNDREENTCADCTNTQAEYEWIYGGCGYGFGED